VRPDRAAGLPIPSACIDFAPSGLPDQPGLGLAFGPALQVLQARTLAEVRGVIEAAEAASLAGRWCVGFVAYEAAAAFDAALPTQAPEPDLPPVWFAVHAGPAAPVAWADARPDAVQADWTGHPPQDRFWADLSALHRAIGDGEVYQVNHTGRLRGTLRSGSPWDLWAALRREQPGGYGAWIDGGGWQVLSASPELFFDWNRQQLLM
jgi:para-aminobenzoate synthetase/4-amino-4-deoxychorismate lyase